MNVRYWYDNYSDTIIFNGYTGATTYAIGRRTGMQDTSGRSMWTYDQRGRLVREQKVVDGTGGGQFVTRWGYNSADLLWWTKYPLNNNKGEGETVYNTYYPRMVVDRVYGTDTCVYEAQYDAAGRLDLLKLGVDAADALLQMDYTYFARSSGTMRTVTG
jgi:YD repeat-containing protein